jgi:hypothetical protein
MSLPQGGFAERGRTGWRRVLVIGAIVFLALIAWTYAVLTYGGDETDGSANEAAQDSSPGAGQSASAPSGGQGVGSETSDADSTIDLASVSAGAPASSSASTRAAPSGEEQGAGGSSYDPLGTGARPGDLTKVDEERARFAAAQFITAAYGYTGDDKDAYNQGVGDTVVWPDFYQTEGSKEIERYAAQVEKTGTKSAAKLTRLDLQQTSPYSASGYAYFETAEGYSAGGEIMGQRRAYRQHMTLRRTDATWSVKVTGPIQEI